MARRGDDRETLFRRGIEIGDVAHTRQGHIKRARDGGGRQRQHIHFRAQFLEMFLMGYTKTLFLVDNDQAEILELNIRRD